LIAKKFQHEIDLEERRFTLEETVKLANIRHEEERIKLETMRESRLSEEANQRKELFEMVKKSMEMMQKCMEK